MSQSLKSISLILLAFHLVHFAAEAATPKKKTPADQPPTAEQIQEAQRILQLAVSASNEKAQPEAAKLLIYSTLLSARTGEIIEISPETRKLYDHIQQSVFAPIVITPLAVAVGFSARQSAETFQSILAPITAILRAVAESIAQSGHLVWNLLETVGIDTLLRSSGDSLHASYKAFEPIIKLFVQKGSIISVATTAGSGLLGASSFLALNDTEEALTHAQIAHLLGYDKELRAGVDQAVDELSAVFTLSKKESSTFRDALVNEMYQQAIQHKFDDDAAYEVDALQLLFDSKLISKDELLTAKTYRELYQTQTSTAMSSRNDLDTLRQNVHSIAALCAVLHELIENGKLSEQDRREAILMKDEALRTLDLVKANLGETK